MTRLIGWLLCGAIVGVLAVTLIGRAIDVEVQDRIIIARSRSGQTLDCARRVGPHGNVFYFDCHAVPEGIRHRP